MKRQLPFILSLALVGGAALLVRPSLRASDVPDSDKVSQLLSEAKSQAYQISADAAMLESYTRSPVLWESHTSAVEQMKAHINEAGRTLAKLEDVRANASPWQVIAIDRIHPLLKEIASNTNAAIGHLNKSPKRINRPEYRDYVVAIADVSNKLAGLVADFVDYGQTKSKLERLTLKLELPEGTE